MGWRPKYFLTLNLFQGVNLVDNRFLFNKLKLPGPSPPGMPESAPWKAQHTCACPVFSCLGRVLTQECQSIMQLSSAPCHRWYLNYASPSQGTCLSLWVSLQAPGAKRRGRVAELQLGSTTDQKEWASLAPSSALLLITKHGR